MRRTLLAMLVLAVALAAAAAFAPGWLAFLLAVVMAKSLVVAGLVVMWRAGLISFGQALFYGVGAYGAGMLGMRWGVTDFFLITLVGAATAGVIAWVLGFLVARYRGIFFANLNLAFSMLLFGYMVKSSTFGGTDGLRAPIPTFLGYEPGDATRVGVLLVATTAVVLPLLALLHRFLDSTAGRMTTAIRDNEIRVLYLGGSVRRTIHLLVVVAAVLAGAGGAMVALAIGHIDPDVAYWTTSGEFLFVAVLAGPAHVLAAVLGTSVFEVIRTYANEYAPQFWQLILGTSLVLSMLFLPDGLWSLAGRLRRVRKEAGHV